MNILNPAYYSSCPEPPVARIECSVEESALAAAAYLGRNSPKMVQNAKPYFGRLLDWAARLGLLLEKEFNMVDAEELGNAAGNDHREVV